MPENCPVCRAPSPHRFTNIDHRDYWLCDVCEARFLDPSQLPRPEEERAHYLLHENDPGDPRYRKFLSRLSTPLLKKLDEGMTGLDYGCGPGPALAAMLSEAGQHVALYDPFFQPNPEVFGQTFDFITCSETSEHFHCPADEFDRLDAMLRPGGWLGVMTCFQNDDATFASWHYRKDPTHVVFYRQTTFHVIAEQHGWSCETPVKDIALMQKS
jgi:hypothetical protein